MQNVFATIKYIQADIVDDVNVQKVIYWVGMIDRRDKKIEMRGMQGVHSAKSGLR